MGSNYLKTKRGFKRYNDKKNWREGEAKFTSAVKKLSKEECKELENKYVCPTGLKRRPNDMRRVTELKIDLMRIGLTQRNLTLLLNDRYNCRVYEPQVSTWLNGVIPIPEEIDKAINEIIEEAKGNVKMV